MTDTRRRVKVYTLNEERQWDDRGTGHVSSAYVERLTGMTLIVRAEQDGSLLLESRILPDTAYQKQQETLITLLTTLFKQLRDDSVEDDRKRGLVGFVKELCSLSQTLQPTSRDEFFKLLGELGVLPAIETLLANDDEQSPSAIDVFAHVVEHSPSMVREYAHKEMTEARSDGNDDELFLLNLVIDQMICDPDPELSCSMQLTGLLRVLLDPENMMANKNEKTEFLGFFYRNCMHVLMAPLLANTADESKLGKDDYQTAHLLSLILELVTFSVEHHTYHVKNYILNKDLLRRVLVLLNSRHKFLALAAIRFTRKIVSTLDEFYNRYIVKGDLLNPVVDALFRSGKRYNLINSTILEMFEYIRVEDIRSLICYVVENHYDRLKEILYVKTFSGLKLRFEQHKSRETKQSSDTTSENTTIRNHRFRRDARAMEEEEELWFEKDDDEDGDHNSSFASGDAFDADTPKINIDSILESEKAPDKTKTSELSKLNTMLQLDPKVEESYSNGTSLPKPEVKSQDEASVTVKNGLIGLVDYSDDESDEEEDEQKSAPKSCEKPSDT
uniref:Serine/threonine-protein phosphatase 4 regulatory subunit 3-like central domain-containing protein n=1 Tax=Ciona savignyi TaxID=51511 RepID=H2YD74_CIOSA